MQNEYRKPEEKSYFGSDYNKFLNEFCSKEMTVNNIDCVQYKRSKQTIRIVESKHINEQMKYSQKELLKLLASVFGFLNKNNILSLTFELFVVTGNFPFEAVKVEDYIQKNSFTTLTREEFIAFCNMEKTVEQIKAERFE